MDKDNKDGRAFAHMKRQAANEKNANAGSKMTIQGLRKRLQRRNAQFGIDDHGNIRDMKRNNRRQADRLNQRLASQNRILM